MYISAARAETDSDLKRNLHDVTQAADSLSRSLRILPSFEATVFFSRLGTGKASFISKLELISEQGGYLSKAIDSDDDIKRLSLENLPILDLYKVYDSGTGESALLKHRDLHDDDMENIEKSALQFIGACLSEGGIWKSEHLIAQLIQK